MAGFIGGIGEPAVAVLERTTATRTTTIERDDFRVEFKCKRGKHYAQQLRGRGKKRTKENDNYHYLGTAEVVAQRGGFYAQRWLEYQQNHECSFA